MAEAWISRFVIPLGLKERWQSLADWWLAGLHDLLPQNWLRWFQEAQHSKLLLELDGVEVVLRIVHGPQVTESRMPVREFDRHAIDACIARAGLARGQVVVAGVLKSGLFFVRNVAVPQAALPALPEILEQDVLRRTPFPLAEIWHGAVPNSRKKRDADGVLDFRHWIIRKDIAEAALAQLRLSSTDVDAIAVAEPAFEPIPVIALEAKRPQEPAWVHPVRRCLIGCSVAVAILGIFAFDWCQSRVADGLDASLAEIRDRGNVRGNQTSRLFALKADVGVLDIWDELSRLLPENTFLSEMNIRHGKVLITGYSADAARLVRLIDESAIFSNAALTSAITPHASEHKDRFSVSFNIRGDGAKSPQGGRDD